jgi:hypothetical protein
MDKTVVSHIRRGYRYMQVAVWGLMLLYLGLAVVLVFRRGTQFPVLAGGAFVFFLLYIPFLHAEDEIRFVTNRSQVQVRDEFQSVSNPLAIWAHAMADEGGIETHENGATYETTQLFGLRSVRTRFETEQRPNGDLLVRTWKNGSESSNSSVSIGSADSTGTLVTVKATSSNRINLRLLFLLAVRDNQLVAAWEENGYELIDKSTHIGLR